jgi:hypothetical protein
MTMSDVHHLIDHFATFKSSDNEFMLQIPGAILDNPIYKPPGRCLGVRIPSEVDNELYGSFDLVSVTIPKRSPIYHKKVPGPLHSTIFKLLGLPYVLIAEPFDSMLTIPGAPAMPAPTRPVMNNVDAYALMLDVNRPIHQLLQTRPLKLGGPLDRMGTVLIARTDYKDTLPQQVEVLIAYCKMKVGLMLCRVAGLEVNPTCHSWFGDSFDPNHMPPKGPLTMADVKKAITKDSFVKFFDTYCKKRGWEDVKSPYDM